MRTLITRALIMGVAGTLLIGGTASAHSFTDQTTLSIRVRPAHVTSAGLVSISGHLQADHRFCERNSKIVLKKVVSGPDPVIGSTFTDDSGYYQFAKHPRVTTTYYTRFNGKTGGTHPHSHVCLGDRSPNATVAVS